MTAGPPPNAMNPGPGQPWRFDPAELADLYALGALTEVEAAELDARLIARDEAMLAELRRVAPIVSALAAGLVEAGEPAPESVRGEVLSRIDAMKQSELTERSLVEDMFAEEREAVAARGRGARVEATVGAGIGASGFSPEIVIRRAAEGRWWPTGLPGVWGKPLYKSRRADRETLLVKCEPGALIPRHAHEGIEELIVLEGTLRVGDVLLGPGDYIRSTPGADHGDAVSPNGCICLFFTSHGVMSPRSQLVMFFRGIAHWFGSLFGGRR